MSDLHSYLITGLECLNSCVNLTEVVQWLRLALSKGPNWVGVFSPPFSWGWKQFQFPKHRVFYFLEYWTMEKSKKSSNLVVWGLCLVEFVIMLLQYMYLKSFTRQLASLSRKNSAQDLKWKTLTSCWVLWELFSWNWQVHVIGTFCSQYMLGNGEFTEP
jgi:hypothetical protein